MIANLILKLTNIILKLRIFVNLELF